MFFFFKLSQETKQMSSNQNRENNTIGNKSEESTAKQSQTEKRFPQQQRSSNPVNKSVRKVSFATESFNNKENIYFPTHNTNNNNNNNKVPSEEPNKSK